MGRYIRDFGGVGFQEQIMNEVDRYLTSEGYEYVDFKGERVYKKGHGLAAGPTFIKVSFDGYGNARVEAWMKFAILPGVYAGEVDLKSFVGSAVKGPLKTRVAYIEDLIMRNSAAYAPMQGYSQYGVPQNAPQYPRYGAPGTASAVCPACGRPYPASAPACPVCGRPSGGRDR